MVVEPQTPALTPRAATWLILQCEAKRAEEAAQQMAKLRNTSHSPTARRESLEEKPLKFSRLDSEKKTVPLSWSEKICCLSFSSLPMAVSSGLWRAGSGTLPYLIAVSLVRTCQMYRLRPPHTITTPFGHSRQRRKPPLLPRTLNSEPFTTHF
jgi:hypothetical protein